MVLLRGFAITLYGSDFWDITVKGARIFNISHEFEWQHQATMDHCLRRDQQLLRCLRIRSRETTSVTRDCKAATWKNSDVPLREMVLHLQHSETPPLLAPASLRNGLCCLVVLQARGTTTETFRKEIRIRETDSRLSTYSTRLPIGNGESAFVTRGCEFGVTIYEDVFV